MMTHLDVLVRVYIRINRPMLRDILDWYRLQPFDVALEHSATAIDGDEKKRGHAFRLTTSALAAGNTALNAVADDLLGCQNYECLLQIIEAVTDGISGLGVLYSYDTALRLGANRNMLPAKVYLHAGTAKGAKRLGVTVAGHRYLDPAELPAELHQLEPYEMEDFLCIYKDKLTGDM